jgi:hypothetical protein
MVTNVTKTTNVTKSNKLCHGDIPNERRNQKYRRNRNADFEHERSGLSEVFE